MKKMKTLIVLILTLALVMSLAACQSEQDKLYSEMTQGASSAAPEQEAPLINSQEPNGLSGTLRISTIAELEHVGISQLVKAFTEKYPDVKIEMDYGMTYEELTGDMETFNTALYQYRQRLATEIIGGEGPDLIYGVDFPVEKYAGSGLLVDFYELMDADSDFDQARLFTSVLESFEMQGGLYMLPQNVTLPYVILHKHALEAAQMEQPETVDYEFLVELYTKAQEADSGIQYVDYGGEGGKNFAYTWEYPQYLDYTAQKAAFNSSEFIHYLETTNSVHSPYPVLDGSAGYGDTALAEFEAAQDSVALFCQLNPQNIELLHYDSDSATKMLPLLSSDGKQLATTMDAYMIPVSGEKELAWELVKFGLTEYEQTAPIGFDIDKALCEKILGEDFPQAEAAVGTVQGLCFLDEEVYRLVSESLVNFYDNGLLTAQECAQEMQEKVEIYLHE